MAKVTNKDKKKLLKKLVSAKTPALKGLSPFKLDNGLGKKSLIATPDIGGGNGSNLGKNGVF